jgi:hypothetical protein
LLINKEKVKILFKGQIGNVDEDILDCQVERISKDAENIILSLIKASALQFKKVQN